MHYLSCSCYFGAPTARTVPQFDKVAVLAVTTVPLSNKIAFTAITTVPLSNKIAFTAITTVPLSNKIAFTAITTGWGAQSWTTFCGPPAVAIGGCERKY
jgi:hypothetical protein